VKFSKYFEKFPIFSVLIRWAGQVTNTVDFKNCPSAISLSESLEYQALAFKKVITMRHRSTIIIFGSYDASQLELSYAGIFIIIRQ
jgi:hypothetical protein